MRDFKNLDVNSYNLPINILILLLSTIYNKPIGKWLNLDLINLLKLNL